MFDVSAQLRIIVERQLVHRGRRDAYCRVYGPGPSKKTYTIALEAAGVRDQFYVDARLVEQFKLTENDQFVLSDIRAGIKSFERLLQKKRR